MSARRDLRFAPVVLVAIAAGHASEATTSPIFTCLVAESAHPLSTDHAAQEVLENWRRAYPGFTFNSGSGEFVWRFDPTARLPQLRKPVAKLHVSQRDRGGNDWIAVDPGLTIDGRGYLLAIRQSKEPKQFVLIEPSHGIHRGHCDEG